MRPDRYSDRPTGWRTRLTGAGGTTMLATLPFVVALVTWRAVQPVVTMSTPPLAIDLLPLSTPPEPVQEVPEGPQRTQQEEQKPQDRPDLPEPPDVPLPTLSPVAVPVKPPARQVVEVRPVPETTAPRALQAPPGRRASNDTEASWEALLKAHLEKHRRYPLTARAMRIQGIAHVRFRMSRAGKLLSVTLSRSSGFDILDRAALDTIRRAQPLPPIPAERADELELSIPVEFFLKP